MDKNRAEVGDVIVIVEGSAYYNVGDVGVVLEVNVSDVKVDFNRENQSVLADGIWYVANHKHDILSKASCTTINDATISDWDKATKNFRGVCKSIRDKQVGGDHYKKFNIQPWDVISEYTLNFWEGNVVKYLLREKGNRLEDLKKARHYLDRQIELLEKDNG